MRLAKKDGAQKKNSNYSALQKIQKERGQSPLILWFGPTHRGLEAWATSPASYMKPTQPSLIITWKHVEEEEMSEWLQ